MLISENNLDFINPKCKDIVRKNVFFLLNVYLEYYPSMKITRVRIQKIKETNSVMIMINISYNI